MCVHVAFFAIEPQRNVSEGVGVCRRASAKKRRGKKFVPPGFRDGRGKVGIRESGHDVLGAPATPMARKLTPMRSSTAVPGSRGRVGSTSDPRGRRQQAARSKAEKKGDRFTPVQHVALVHNREWLIRLATETIWLRWVNVLLGLDLVKTNSYCNGHDFWLNQSCDGVYTNKTDPD